MIKCTICGTKVNSNFCPKCRCLYNINSMEDLNELPIGGEELRVTVTTSNPEIGDIVTKTSVYDGNPINVTANETVTITKPTQINSMVGEENEKSNNIANDNGCEQHFCDTNDNETSVSSISITDNGKVYEFEKPEFECEYIGSKSPHEFAMWVKGNGVWMVFIYTFAGVAWYNQTTQLPFNLTPIKSKWFEDESNFPCIMTKIKKSRTTYKSFEYRDFKNLFDSGWRLATKEEVSSLYYEDK